MPNARVKLRRRRAGAMDAAEAMRAFVSFNDLLGGGAETSARHTTREARALAAEGLRVAQT